MAFINIHLGEGPITLKDQFDPDDTFTLAFIWDAFVDAAGTTVSTSSFVVTGLTGGTEQTNQTQVHDGVTYDAVQTISLSGGTEGEDAEVTNRCALANGEQFDKTVIVRIRKQ